MRLGHLGLACGLATVTRVVKCFFGELYCSLDDRLGELYCSERLLDQLCWVTILLVNRSVLLLNFCMRLFLQIHL